MKLTNHNFGYSSFFDCVFRGQITMTSQELAEVLKDKLIYRSIFNKADIYNCLNTGKHSYIMNLRVSATEAIAHKYQLKKYRPQNYRLNILIN